MVLFRLITLIVLIDLLRGVLDFIVSLFIRVFYNTMTYRIIRDICSTALIYISASQLLAGYENSQFLLIFLAAVLWYFIFIGNGTYNALKLREASFNHDDYKDRNFLYDLQYIGMIVVTALYHFFTKASMAYSALPGLPWIAELAIIEQNSAIRFIFSGVGLLFSLMILPYLLVAVAFLFSWILSVLKPLQMKLMLKAFGAFWIGLIFMTVCYYYIHIPIVPCLSIHICYHLFLSYQSDDYKLRLFFISLLALIGTYFYGFSLYATIRYYPTYGNILAIAADILNVFTIIGAGVFFWNIYLSHKNYNKQG